MISENLRKKIYERDNYSCQYCGRNLHFKTIIPGLITNDDFVIIDKELTIDHVIPKAWGGIDKEDNLVTCCHRCNMQKGCKLRIKDIQRVNKKMFLVIIS
jgi:5-methylcytosine-specific restriction endonuclease McrA